MNHSKLKRQASSPLLDCAIENLTDAHPNKIPRTGPLIDAFCSSTPMQQQNPQQQSGIPSFSVQIVQQFSSNSSQSPHSQTIQTNVTVQTLAGNGIKTSNSHLAANSISATSSPGGVGSNVVTSDNNQLNNPSSNGAGAPSSSVSVGGSIECKKEPETNFTPCSVNGSHPLSELNSELTSANNTNATTTSSTAATTGDRFSDSLANLGFPEDSNDDVIHPDILKDIIDDVFTNPSDLMNGFNFVDSLGLKDNNSQDEKNSLKTMSLNKSMENSPPNNFQSSTNSPGFFSLSQSQQTVFDFQTGNLNSNSTSQSVPNSNNGPPGFTSGRLGSYAATSPNMQGTSNNGLGLDFKLTEPSPAAQTLKQMAEQHQNMQQKQQQMGMGIGTGHPRSPFSDSFPDPLSNIRGNFLNGSPNSMSSVQKSPTGLFQPVGFTQQQGFTVHNNSAVKQEVVTPNTPVYPSNINTHLAEVDLHKRRQLMQLQQNQIGNVPRPPFSHSPDKKRPYQGMRSLPLYNDLSPGQPQNEGSASNSPVPHHPAQFMRGVSTPGVTPPPQGFGSSPSPSSGVLHLSQSQQIQLSAKSQQLQVSQSQQQLLLSQDLKPGLSVQQQRQIQNRGFLTGQASLQMSQSQSLSFQFPGHPSRSLSPTTNQRTSGGKSNSSIVLRHLQPTYMSRPPPEYPTAMELNNRDNMNLQPNILSQGNKTQSNIPDNMSLINEHRSLTDQRNGTSLTPSQSYSSIMQVQPNSVSTSRTYTGLSVSSPYPGATSISNVCANEASISKQYGSSASERISSIAPKSYSGVPISETISDILPKGYQTTISVSEACPVSKSYSSGPISNLIRTSVSTPYPRVSVGSDIIPTAASKQYSDLNSNPEGTSLNIPKSYHSGNGNNGTTNVCYTGPNTMSGILSDVSKSFGVLQTSNAAPISVSRPYSSTMPNSNTIPVSIAKSFTGSVPISSLMDQSQSQSMIISGNSINPTYTASKVRGGKHINSRMANKPCSVLTRQKAPNVNVGPEGLNISQRLPTMATDWRQAYMQHPSQQIVTNINTQLRKPFPRNNTQNYSHNISSVNGNAFQNLHMNPTSTANGNSNISSSPISDQAPNNIHDMNSPVTTNLLIQQQQQMLISNDGSLLAPSQYHMAASSASNSDPMSQSSTQMFSNSPSPNNTSHNIVVDENQFNLDFLDNLDCSTSDLLNFDVLQGGNTSFPLLEDVSLLDK